MHDGPWLLNALNKHWLKYRKRLNKCRHASSEAAVHKLRISCRRLLSLIELILTLTPQPDLRKLRKALKAQLDAFDELRDTQVMLLEVSSDVTALPELTPFLHQLHVNAQRLLIQTPMIIKSQDNQKLRKYFKTALGNLEQALNKSDLKQPILAGIDQAYQTTMERYQAIEPTQPDTLHRLRISLKKIRYALVCAEGLLPTLPASHLKQMQSYLTNLGDIQNSRVLSANLTNFFTDVPPTIQAYYQQRHSTLIQTYMAKRNDILQFWRPDADHPFPWE